MNDFDINEVLAQEALELRAHEGDITACFTLINRIDRFGGDDRDVWSDCLEAKFETSSPWEIAEDLASAYTELAGEIPREWLDDARACEWLLSADGTQALAYIRQELQPEPSGSDDGVWTVRTNNELSEEIDRSGNWVALTKLAPTALTGDMPRVPRSTLLDQLVEFGTLISEPWPGVVQRAEAGDLTAWALLAARPQFESVYDNATDVDFEPDTFFEGLRYSVEIDDAFLGAVATAFSKNRFLLADFWKHGPEVCELVTGSRAWNVISDIYTAVLYRDSSEMRDLLARGGWYAFAHTASDQLVLSDGVRLTDARLGPFELLIDQYLTLTIEYCIEQDPMND